MPVFDDDQFDDQFSQTRRTASAAFWVMLIVTVLFFCALVAAGFLAMAHFGII